MASGVGKSRLKTLAAAVADLDAKMDAGYAGSLEAWQHQHVLDVELVAMLLTEELSAGQRRSVEQQRDWLQGNPSRPMHHLIRQKLEHWERGIRRGKKLRSMGVPAAPPSAYKRKPRAHAWAKRERPSWMSDPSLLPKRPPGRAA